MILRHHVPFNHDNMTNRFNRHVLSLLLTAIPAGMAAQEGDYLYDNAVQTWRNTASSAALTIDSTSNRGYAEFNFLHDSGSYRRVQEGSSENQFSFFTERYQQIGKYLYGYGSFKFEMGRTQERAWCDEMRPFNSNPFITGSSVAGKYDNQSFDLSARLGTTKFGGWRFGVGIDYKVADLSRLRDPRSRSRLLDYQLAPSVAFTAGNNTIGITGSYHRRKEKMPTLTTVQNNPDLYYYQMTGLDAITGTIGGYSGFSREYVNHEFGAELEYGYKSTGFSTVNTFEISRASESMYEQYKREPGKYYSYKYGIGSHNRIFRSGIMHEIDIDACLEQSYADEYRPLLIIDIDPQTGQKSFRYENMMTYKKRYQQQIMDFKLRYRVNRTAGNTVRNYFGFMVDIPSISQKHLLPHSTFRLNTVDLNAEYGQGLFRNKCLWLMLEAGYMVRTKSELSLSTPDTEYATQVLLKDLKYYGANCFHGNLSVKYQFPLKIKKTRILCYVKVYAGLRLAQHSLSSKNLGVTLGIYN